MKWTLFEETTAPRVGGRGGGAPPLVPTGQAVFYSSLLLQSAFQSQVTVSINHVSEGLLGDLKSNLLCHQPTIHIRYVYCHSRCYL